MDQGLEAGALSRAEAASLLRWWLDAGVDTPVQEEARDWRVRSAPPTANDQSSRGAEAPPTGASATLPAPASERSSLPETLEAFHAWLAESADLPLFRSGAARALPHGPANADLMLLGGPPTAEDAAEGRPIGGEAWLLATRMLQACGLKSEQAYVAALSCFSPIGTRFSKAEGDACRDTILKQISLVAPKRLLLLGDGPAKLLLGQPMASARGKLHRLAGVPTVVTFPPRQLLANSSLKPLAWADLLLIMGV